MKNPFPVRELSIFLGLLFLCSCATRTPVDYPLPASMAMNPEAGRGGFLTVTVTVNGQKLPFAMDTGAPVTVLSKSLEPQLGKPLGQSTLNWWNGNETSSVYAAPKLFLGGVPLFTTGKVFTSDLRRTGPHAMGVLGMDCLRHYCLQLDFAAGQIRFLPAGQRDAGEWGRAFPLTFTRVGRRGGLVQPKIHVAGLVAGHTNLLVDTGCTVDGIVDAGAIEGIAMLLPEYVWEGETFTNVLVAAANHFNALGLSFLARHLVTLDFPNRTLYLKQVRADPLAGDVMTEISGADHRRILEAYMVLRKANQLPGLSATDQGVVYLEGNQGSKSVTFGFRNNGEPTIHHYQARRMSEASPWQVEKTWRTELPLH